MGVEGIESSSGDLFWEQDRLSSKDVSYHSMLQQAVSHGVEALRRPFTDRQIDCLEHDWLSDPVVTAVLGRASSRRSLIDQFEVHGIGPTDRSLIGYRPKPKKGTETTQQQPSAEDAEIESLYYTICVHFTTCSQKKAAEDRLRILAATNPKAAKKIEHIDKARAKAKDDTTFFEDVAHAAKKVGHAVKEFVKEYKTEIIVIAATVVAVAIVAGIVTATTAGGAEAIAAALRKKKEEEGEDDSSPVSLGNRGESSPDITLKSSPDSSTPTSSLSGGDFSHVDSPFTEAPSLNTSRPNELAMASRPSSTWTPQTSKENEPSINRLFVFADPEGGVRVYNSSPTSKPVWEAPSHSVAFADPEGGVRAYHSSNDEIQRGLPFANVNANASIVDPDCPLRIYTLPPSEPLRSSSFEIPGIELARGKIGGINGIGNNLADANENGKYLRDRSGGYHIEWVHNRSHSTLVDIAETVYLNYQNISAPAELIKANLIQFHQEHANDPGAKYLQFCHSQGATAVRVALLDLPKEIRDRVIVVAIAPAVVIPRELCFDSFNYASKRDPIPLAEFYLHASSDDPLIRELAYQKLEEIQRELIFLEPHPDANTWLDHAFESPTFKETIDKHLARFVAQYGKSK